MNKVVYNSNCGEFLLSMKAVEWLEQNCKDNKLRDFIESMHIVYYEQLPLVGRDCPAPLKDEYICCYVSDWFEDIRHHKDLVAVVEALGNDVNGRNAKLAIANIYGNQYRIDQYDVAESVITPEDNEHWITID